MKILITYDIVEDKVRNKLVERLLDFNLIRVQGSVFLGDVEEDEVIKIEEYSKLIMNEDTDSIYLCKLCEEDFYNIEYVGKKVNSKLLTEKIMFF